MQNRLLPIILLLFNFLTIPCLAQQTSSEQKSTKDFQFLLDKGKDAFNAGNYFAALEYLKQAEQLEPQNQEVHYFLGYSYAYIDSSEITDFGLTLKSSKHFEKVIEISPQYKGEIVILDPYSRITANWGSLAMAYLAESKVDSAIWAFKEGQRRGGFFQEIMEINKNIMVTCAKDAILFTNGDNDTYPMLFLQVVENYRRDISVVNLNLLNTPWFIKQIRDTEPKVPIEYTDEEIKLLEATIWKEPKKIKIDISREKMIDYIEKKDDDMAPSVDELPESPGIGFELKSTVTISGHPFIRVQDQMVIHILKVNNFNRPIYFSVTVAPQNLLDLYNRSNTKGQKNYLRIDGLAFRLVPYGGGRNFISPGNLESTLFTKVHYKTISDGYLKYNNTISGFWNNYRAVFFRLIKYYQNKGMTDKAMMILDKMNEVLPADILPLSGYAQKQLDNLRSSVKKKAVNK